MSIKLHENLVNDGLPEEWFNLLNIDTYSMEMEEDNAKCGIDKTFISVSGLIGEPKEYFLTKANKGSIRVNASSTVKSTIGELVHKAMEELYRGKKGFIVEERLYYDYMGYILSGKFDKVHVDNGISELSDYKMTSAFYITDMVNITKWTKQMNVYAFLLKEIRNIDITSIRIIYGLWDWSERQLRNSNYPKQAVGELNIPVWTYEEQKEYVHSQMDLFISHIDSCPDDIPECSRESRWEKLPTYALYVYNKNGSRPSSAKRVMSDKEMLMKYAQEKLTEEQYARHIIEFRPSIPKKCLSQWCKVSRWCNWIKEYNNKNMSKKFGF